jgi:hypothetical protein
MKSNKIEEGLNNLVIQQELEEGLKQLFKILQDGQNTQENLIKIASIIDIYGKEIFSAVYQEIGVNAIEFLGLTNNNDSSILNDAIKLYETQLIGVGYSTSKSIKQITSSGYVGAIQDGYC